MSKELMNTTEMKEVISKRTACMKVFEHADPPFYSGHLRHTGSLHEGRPMGRDRQPFGSGS